MTRTQRIAIWVATLVGLLVAWKVFGQGFGSFNHDLPYLVASRTVAVNLCVPSTVTNVPNLKVWWKADALVYKDNGTTPAVDGDGVYLWKDSSINGNDLVQTDAGTRSYFNSSGLNGLPTIGFTNKAMDVTLASTIDATNTVFIVYNLKGSSPDPSYIFASAAAGCGYLFNGGNMEMTYDGNFIKTSHPNGFLKTWYYDTLWYSDVSDSSAWTNGVVAGVTEGGWTAGTWATIRLGRSKYGDQGGTFEIAEMIVYQGKVSTANASNINCYLKTKYGL